MLFNFKQPTASCQRICTIPEECGIMPWPNEPTAPRGCGEATGESNGVRDPITSGDFNQSVQN